MNNSKNIEAVGKKCNLIRKNFECTICIDLFVDPVITNCQHVFCKNCIENYIGSKRNVRCPLCKTNINLRSLRKFESLDKYVEKVKELSDAFNQDSKNYKSNQINDLNEQNENQDPNEKVCVASKRKRSSSQEKDLVKKKKTNDSKTTLEIDGENRLSFGLEKQHTEQHSKVEQWLSKTINQMPEKQALMSDSDKICSKITITRIEKPMNETNFPNNSDLITNKSNFIENNCSNVKEKSDYTEKTDYPLKFRKEDSEVTVNISSKLKLLESTKETTRIWKPNQNLPSNINNVSVVQDALISNQNNPLVYFDQPQNNVFVAKIRNPIKYIYKGILADRFNKRDSLQADTAINTDNKSSNTNCDIFKIFEILIINDIHQNLINEAINCFIKEKSEKNETSSTNQSNTNSNEKFDATLILSNQSKLSNSYENENTIDLPKNQSNKKKQLFKRNSIKPLDLEFTKTSETPARKLDQNEQHTIINETTSDHSEDLSHFIIADTPTKNDSENQNESIIDKTLSKSSNRMELVDSRFFLESFINRNETTLVTLPASDEESVLEKTTVEETNKSPKKKLNMSSVNKNNDKSITQPNKQNTQTKEISYFINDSTRDTTVNTFVNTSKEVNMLPPAAADILGMSYARDSLSITNNLVSGTNKSSMNKTKLTYEPIVEQAQETSNDTEQIKETELLTDSELNLIDNLSNQIDTVNLGSLESKTNCKNFEFVSSLLTPDKKEWLKTFAYHTDSKIANDVTETTTHLIVESDEYLKCGVTSKYLKAISRNLWIVSIMWIKYCLDKNIFVDMAPFEIKGDGIFGLHDGPRKSRMNKRKLLANYDLMLIGKFETETITLEEMKKLTELNGGRVVSKAKDFGDNCTRVLILDKKCNNISKQTLKEMREKASINSVSVSWFLDSLACYDIYDFKEYKLDE